jgi:hypothetical protein
MSSNPNQRHPAFLAGIALFAVALSSGCDHGVSEDCGGECNNFWPRLAVGVVNYQAVGAGTDEDTGSFDTPFHIVFRSSSGNEYIYNSAEPTGPLACEHHPSGMVWTACSTNGPADEWVDVTVAPDIGEEATARVLLAQHNYCGHDIAYLVANLHEDGLPTFGEVLYVSPCESGPL